MSDIGIRFDGLLLEVVIALSVLTFAIVAVVGLALAGFSAQRRRHWIGFAMQAGAQSCIGVICLFAAIAYIETGTLPGPWIDWMVLPWLVLVAFGFLRLVRFRRDNPKP